MDLVAECLQRHPHPTPLAHMALVAECLRRHRRRTAPAHMAPVPRTGTVAAMTTVCNVSSLLRLF
jgi:hypothetical protein